jgi:hypothetical protein
MIVRIPIPLAMFHASMSFRITARHSNTEFISRSLVLGVGQARTGGDMKGIEALTGGGTANTSAKSSINPHAEPRAGGTCQLEQ